MTFWRARSSGGTYKGAWTATLSRTLCTAGCRNWSAVGTGCFGRSLLGPEICEPPLELLGRLDLDLLGGPAFTGRRVASGLEAFSLGIKVVFDDALLMLFPHILGQALHSEDLDIQPLAVRQGIFYVGERLLVDLVHVHGETCERALSAGGHVRATCLTTGAERD